MALQFLPVSGADAAVHAGWHHKSCGSSWLCSNPKADEQQLLGMRGGESFGPLLFAQPRRAGGPRLGRLLVPCMAPVCSGRGQGESGQRSLVPSASLWGAGDG